MIDMGKFTSTTEDVAIDEGIQGTREEAKAINAALLKLLDLVPVEARKKLTFLNKSDKVSAVLAHYGASYTPKDPIMAEVWQALIPATAALVDKAFNFGLVFGCVVGLEESSNGQKNESSSG